MDILKSKTQFVSYTINFWFFSISHWW